LISDVGFAGTFERERADQLIAIAAAGHKVTVRGAGPWHKIANSHPNLTLHREAVGDDYVDFMRATKVNLCFLRKVNRDLQTARSVEIPASGGFMLAERTNEHLRLFEEDKEAAYFSSTGELLEKVNFYLANDAARNHIALAGRRRCEQGGYSIQRQLPTVLSQVLDFKNRDQT
jgi:spore maturation protein CgeB